MKKYEELTAYDKVDFLTEVLGFNEKKVTDFLSNVYHLFNNPNIEAQLKCEKYPSLEELQNMVFDTLIYNETVDHSNLKGIYEWVYGLESKIQKYNKKVAGN